MKNDNDKPEIFGMDDQLVKDWQEELKIPTLYPVTRPTLEEAERVRKELIRAERARSLDVFKAELSTFSARTLGILLDTTTDERRLEAVKSEIKLSLD